MTCIPCLQDEKGQNALMLATMAGHDSVVEILLEAGTPWNALDKDGNCAGDLAMLAGHQSTIDLLLEAGPPYPHFFFTPTSSGRGLGKCSISLASHSRLLGCFTLYQYMSSSPCV